MKANSSVKEGAVFISIWIVIALVSTAIAFVFIIGFRQVLGI